MQALRDQWTPTSRLFHLGGRKFAMDTGIAWQNYRDDSAIWQEIDLTPVASPETGFDLMIEKAPYRAHFGLNGARRIQPDRNDGGKSIDFPVGAFLSGKTFSQVSDGLLWQSAQFDIAVRWEVSRIKFDIIIKSAIAFDSIAFDVTKTGVSDAELLAFLGALRVYEQNDPDNSRALDVSLAGGQITIGWDLTGMMFPVVVDPTIDIQISANADDASRDSTPGYSPGSFADSAGESVGIIFDCYMRFVSITIPKNATINVAHIRFNPNVADSGTVARTNLFAEAVDNSSQLTTLAEYNAASGNPTTKIAFDNIPAWAIDVEEQSASIVAPLQELINRAGWNSGNAQNWFWEDDGGDVGALRRSDSHDGSAGQAPILHAEYTEAAAAALGNRGANVGSSWLLYR